MKRLFLLCIVSILLIGCTDQYILPAINKKYPDAEIHKLVGSKDLYIIKTSQGDIRFLDMCRTNSASPDVDQRIHFTDNKQVQGIARIKTLATPDP